MASLLLQNIHPGVPSLPQKSKNVEDAINCAQESIKNATLAYRYTLPYLENELKGVWIRPNQKTIEEVQKTLDLIKETGINNVFLETYFHGYTIYPSHVMEEYGFTTQNPSFTNFDMLKVWTKEAHKRGIKVHTALHLLKDMASAGA